MLVKTRKLPPTQTEGARMRATCDAGTLTIPYPQHAVDPGRVVALMLARAFGFDDAEHITGSGNYRLYHTYQEVQGS